ncbi:MAG: hypothetical protein IK104_07185 [Clostridia bacterium]|nr:hypothetical protein [Clostridia bacterium]
MLKKRLCVLLCLVRATETPARTAVPPEEPTEPATEPVTEPPTEPVTEPSTEPQGCTHICHSTNPFYRIVWRVLNTVYKLFRINKTCSCGAEHW